MCHVMKTQIAQRQILANNLLVKDTISMCHLRHILRAG